MSQTNPTLSVRQLIYTNVEAAQSPQRRAGFQILLASQGINEGDKQEVSKRLTYDFTSQENSPTKHVFYATRNGDLLLAQIVSLPEPDGAGRFGRYFAHALIFSSAEFEELENDPFPIFSSFDFLTTVEEALNRGDNKTGDIAPELRNVAEWKTVSNGSEESSASRTQVLDEMNQQNRRQLLLLANHLAEGKEQQNSIGFFGEPAATFRYLSALFALTPKSLRPRCSFDTFFTGTLTSSVPYWSIGLPTDAMRSPRLYAFNLERKEFEHTVSKSPETIYETWLDEQSHRRSTDIAAECDAAARFTGWLENPDFRLGKPVSQAENQVWIALASRNLNAVEQRLRERLELQTGESLASVLAPKLIAPLLNQRSLLDAITSCERGFLLDDLTNCIWSLCTDSKVHLTPEVLEDIKRFADDNNQKRLNLAILRLAHQWERLASELQKSSDDDYRFFASWVLDSTPIQLNWDIQHEDESLSFGPQLSVMRSRNPDSEFQPLFYALLGKIMPEPKSWFNPGRKRYDDGHLGHQTSAVNVRRWFWLMEELEKRQNQLYQRNSQLPRPIQR